MTKRFCYACDLKDNPELIKEYKRYHAIGNVWPEITNSIKIAGIEDMQIYLIANRLFMILEVNELYDPKKKSETDAANPIVQEWETLMWKFQAPLPWARNGEKWMEMEKIFELEK